MHAGSKYVDLFDRDDTAVPLSFSLHGEYVVRFLLPDDVFLPRDHGLDFFTSAYSD